MIADVFVTVTPVGFDVLSEPTYMPSDGANVEVAFGTDIVNEPAVADTEIVGASVVLHAYENSSISLPMLLSVVGPASLKVCTRISSGHPVVVTRDDALI